MREEGKKPSLGRQAMWLVAAKVIGFACNLALPILLARALSPREYGLFKQSFLVVTTLLGILPLGMGMSAYFYLARSVERRGQTILNILIFHGLLGAVAGLLLATAPGLWQAIFPTSPELAERGGRIGLLLFVSMISTLLETMATANQDVKRSTLFIVGAQGSKSLLLAGAVIWRPDLDTLIAAGLLHACLEGLVLLWYLRGAFPGYWREWDREYFLEQLRYAAPLGFAGLVYTAQLDLANYFVGWRFGPAAYAVYANGNFQIPLLGLVRESITSLLLTRISALEAGGNSAEIARLSDQVSARLILLYFPAAVFFFYYAEELILLIYGPLYLDSAAIFRVAVLAFPLQAFVVDPLLRSYAELRQFLLRLRLLILIVLGVALWLAEQRNSLLAIMTVVVTVQVSERLVLLWKVRTVLGEAGSASLPHLLRQSGKIAALSLLPLLVLRFDIWEVPSWPSWVRLLVGAVVYGVSFLSGALLSGSIRPKELLNGKASDIIKS